jgi:O-antigen ligase/tetratricopeptide (TPR) repeat protein
MKDVLKAVVFGGLFAVPFLTLYVENDYFFPYITGKNFWFRIIVDVTVAAWVLLALADAKYRPRFSWILSSFSLLLIIMFFANLFGVHPESSFWSNFERMDGYVSLVHTFFYALVLGSVLTTREEWQKLLNTSLVVAFLVALYGLAQYGGLAEGSGRIDSRLGNAAYMAVYMLFHIFIAFWLFVESKKQNTKIAYGFLAAMFTFVLIETGTRGTAIGLVVGILVMSGYVGLFGTKFKEFRKYAVGAFAFLILIVGSFIAARDSEFIQSSPNLARIANISINDLSIRATIWGMAWEGVKERPLLGYGQSNFNYVFNKNYDPSLYAQEQWFDRSHNIFFDWLTTGGFLGLLSYLSIFVACLYYLFVRPLLDKGDSSFTVLERGVLLGILAGYFTHNLVVFDNIVSYIFFAMVLGIIHSRVSVPMKRVESLKVDEAILVQFAIPVVSVVTIVCMYFAHAPGMAAAADIIDAMRTQDPAKRLEAFDKALERDSFARQEIVEQLAQNAASVIQNQKVPQDVRNMYMVRAEEELLKLAQYKPGDARIHVFIATYYRTVGQYEKSLEQIKIARELSPRKQSIIEQQGFIELTLNQNEQALKTFKEAYDLDQRSPEAREYYAGALFYNKQPEAAVSLMDSDAVKQRFARSDFLLGAAHDSGQTDFLIELFKIRIENDKANAQNWATLAFLYTEKKDKESALKTLEEGMKAAPTFTKTAQCIADNIKNDRNPEEGCTAAAPAAAPASKQ